MLFSTLATIEFVSYTVASTDQDGDGLTYGLEYLINTQPNDWDTDNDQLPDGWEWKYGLDPLSSSNNDGAIGDLMVMGSLICKNITTNSLQTGIYPQQHRFWTMVFGGMEQFLSALRTRRMPCNTILACGDTGSTNRKHHPLRRRPGREHLYRWF